MRGLFFFCLFSLISFNQLFSQISSDQQKKLEAQRTKLMNEIKQINNLLFSNTKIRKNAIDEVEDIQVRLNVRSEFSYENFIEHNFYLKHIPVDEYSNPSFKNLNDGADYINYAKTKNAKIYVHCREGISRAACFVMAYLIKYRGLSYQKAINQIKKRRYFINILKNQVIAIKDFEKELNGYLKTN